jgi:serine/threonine protein kinase/tetratricopeptide (TPR) repeat protein
MISPGVVGSVRLQKETVPCAQCGSTSRVSRGLCLNCLLCRGLGEETYDNETLESVLDEVDVRDADWRLGNYQILEEIGRGGMGVIYRARQRHSRRIVALKRILGYHADSRETLVRFRREAEAAASLDHPNILPIYEVGESDDGLPYFSMKLATGGSLLESHIAFHKDPRRSVSLMAKVTRAVQCAHAHGILHRDLKPGNILLDGRGEPMVSDFGLAKWLETTSDLTRSLTIFGTPGYIAPEQAHGSAAGLKPTADVYSLGAILFDLLAGRPPFIGEHALSVIQQAAEKSAPKLRSFKPNLDRDLETICARCLDREPGARFPSAGDLAEDLERWLEGRPIIARPVSPAVRVWRWSRRNPKLAGSLAAIIILGVAGLVATIASSRLSTIVQNAELARHSIVVMPFEDLDELSTNSDSAKAVTNVLNAALRQTRGIRLSNSEKKDVDPWSADDWKKIGESAGARMILSGTVRQREDKKRIALHLLNSASGSSVSTWLLDIDSLADFERTSIAKISGELGVTPRSACSASIMAFEGDASSIGDTNNPTARYYCDLGKKWLFQYNLKDVDRAIGAFQEAIRRDPNYALAHGLLGSACQARAQTDNSRDWRSEAQVATTTAFRLAPLLPEAYRAQAGTFRRYGKLRAALDPCLTAYELDPSSSRTAMILGDGYELIGRPDLAIDWYERATRREKKQDEMQPVFADNLGNAWADLGDYEKAEMAYRAAIDFKPDLPVGLLGLSAVALYRGDENTARQECNNARLQFKDNPQPLMMAAIIEFFSRHFEAAESLYRQAATSNRSGGADFMGSVRFISALGTIQRLSPVRAKEGRLLLEEARSLDERELAAAPDNPQLLYSLAANQAALGDEGAALRSLRNAISAGWIDYQATRRDPRFDSMRHTNAFNDILARLTNRVEEMRRQLPSRLLAFNINQQAKP